MHFDFYHNSCFGSEMARFIFDFLGLSVRLSCIWPAGHECGLPSAGPGFESAWHLSFVFFLLVVDLAVRWRRFVF